MSGIITKAVVDRTQPTDKVRFVWDAKLSGFGLKVTPSGHKAYVYQYRMGGREASAQRITIGRHGSPWTPDMARARAAELSAEVAAKRDPQQTEKTRRRDAVDLAFDSYSERFIDEHYGSLRASTARVNSNYLKNHAIPVLKRRGLKTITKADITALLSSISSVASRHNTYRVLHKLFQWAVGRGDIEANPMRDMNSPAAPKSRERVLANDELALLWKASEALGAPFGPLIQLLILTGQRRTEVAGMQWSELSRDEALWTLPTARTKNAVAHSVPLTAQAIAIIDAIAQRLAPDRNDGWPRKGNVFPSKKGNPVTGFGSAKAQLDRRIEAIKKASPAETEDCLEEGWTLHDLRRTLTTGFQKLGVRFEVTEAAVNHVSGARGGVAGVYQRHDWKNEKREAFDLWAKYVDSLLKAA